MSMNEPYKSWVDTPATSPLWTRLLSKIVFPLHERLKGHDSVTRLHALERSQWWPRAELEQHRVARLKAMLTYVGRHVPYFRDVFAAIGFDPATVTAVADLQRLPLLTKAIIRDHDLKSDIAGPLKRYNTGGSSGEPLVFYIGRERISHDVAAKWRATRWWRRRHRRPGDRRLGFSDRTGGAGSRAAHSRRAAADQVAAGVRDVAGEARRVRPGDSRVPAAHDFRLPVGLRPYRPPRPGCGLRLDDLGVRVAFVTSERLYDEQREIIASAFGCAVANGYGGRDAGFIAHECPHGGMHVSAEDIVVEIVDADGRVLPPGEAGEIVVTNMATREFPFVRYRTGDVGVLDSEACECGRGLPMLKEIQGRTTDFVVAADGTVMHGLALVYIVRDLEGVKQFKIVQESMALTRVLLVTDERFAAESLSVIEKGFKARLGQAVQVIVENTVEIPAERSGKFRYVVSRVATAQRPGQ